MNDFLIGITQDVLSGVLLAAVLFLGKKLYDYFKKSLEKKYITNIIAEY